MKPFINTIEVLEWMLTINVITPFSILLFGNQRITAVTPWEEIQFIPAKHYDNE